MSIVNMYILGLLTAFIIITLLTIHDVMKHRDVFNTTITKSMTISTAHLTLEDHVHLDRYSSNSSPGSIDRGAWCDAFEFGYVITIDKLSSENKDHPPCDNEKVAKIIKYARSKGIRHLVIDYDGPINNDLPH